MKPMKEGWSSVAILIIIKKISYNSYKTKQSSVERNNIYNKKRS